MGFSNQFDDIMDSVTKDFFGSTDDYYKELMKTSGLKELQKDLERRTPRDAPDGEIAEATKKLAELDAAILGRMGAEEDGKKEGEAAEKDAAKTEAAEAAVSIEPEKSAMEELNDLIGLENIKQDVKELVSFMKIQKMREEKGNRTVPVSLHLVFTGNPGTGKTTIARILARLYKEIGVLTEGQLVEVDRSGLVAGYVGQTAAKTQAKIQEAIGGILFIDEAYTLNKEGNDFGQEAIDTILKAMEDNRKNLIVIVAGYTDLMKDFIESNPGLKSRFNKYIEFPDYTEEELYQIFMLSCSRYGYTLSEEGDKALRECIAWKLAHRDKDFANAREMRNLFESVITNQATRVNSMDQTEGGALLDELLDTLEREDFADYLPPESQG